MRTKGGLTLGVCNGFQILCEAGLLPGVLMRNARLRFICRDVYLRIEHSDSPFTRGYNAGQVIRVPVAHGEGNYIADAETIERLEKEGRVLFRYCSPEGKLDEAWNVNGAINAIAGIVNERGNVLGMMPHPENHVEAAIGVDRRARAVRRAGRGIGQGGMSELGGVAQRTQDHARTRRRARAQARRVQAPARTDRPHADADRARHLLGDVERALLVQVLQGASAHAADQGPARHPGPRRECRRHRHRRWLRLRVQDGEPQPPELHRALSGRGDRRRRHPARRVHHGGAADRLPQRALLRRAGALRRRGISSPAWSPASAATATRLACRRSAARCASIRATTATAWSTPWRSASRARTRFSTPRPPASACPSSISAPRPAATASTAPPWRRPSSARRPRRSARPCRSAIRSRKSCCSKPASRSWPRAASSPSRTWARRA